MKIFNGKIVVPDDDRTCIYEIEQITVEFEEDITDVIGVVRCTGVTIESDAPIEIIAGAEEELYNELADVEFNNSDGDEQYRIAAKEEISERTGINVSRIEIE